MRYLFTLVIFMTSFYSSNAALWEKAASRNQQIPGERKIKPQITALMKLDDAGFRGMQSQVPKEETGRSVIMELPTPDGTTKQFRVFERTSMEPALAAKYPMLKTYEAISVEDASVVAKLDYTLFGFHAMVFSHEGIYFVDPYSNQNTGFYNCYYKKYYTRPDGQYSVCETKSKTETTNSSSVSFLNNPDEDNILNDVAIVPDGKIRKFRLALACTIEYAAAVGGPTPTKATVLSAMLTSLNRVNGVYEKELSIHMDLVAKEDTLIFITSDSYSNNNGGQMLGQNQTICDNRIGTANYDIGHVFSTGGGGVAGLGVVCSAGEKANGVTGSSNPTGDGFDIDYVVHEMGHQYGANHTFNSVTSSCFGNNEPSAAYEPGSGTTIMAYAGICGSDDIAQHSDDYFHRKSIDEIFSYISGTSCAVITNTGNIAPIVDTYTATFNIPYKTSFEITASAHDTVGNPVSYNWEEYDLGPAGAWNAANNTKAPIFRSLLATASGTRVFPKWDSLVRNVIKYKGEVLPEVARTVKFRCTVRDIKLGYGMYNAPNSDLSVVATVTPSLFRVTSQATATVMVGTTTQTVVWDVANTTASPISCSNVDIYLSLDSARTFPILLASNTANDGTEDVVIPDVFTLTSSARIKVKGHGNIFFDLNNGWIKINKFVPLTVAAFTESDSVVCQGSSVTFTNTSTNSPDSVRWTLSGGTPSTSSSLTTFTPTFNTAGLFTVSLVSYKSGFSSIAFVKTIGVNPAKTVNLSQTICEGDSVTIGSQSFKTTGTFTVHLQTSMSCDSAVTLDLTVNPNRTSNLLQTICQGDSVTIGSQSFKTNGTFTVHLQTSLSCDSAVTLNLTVNPKASSNISNTICEGDSVTVGSQSFKTNGTFTVHLQTSLSCDSAVTLNLTVKPKSVTNLVDTICGSDSLIIGGQVFKFTGNYTITLQAANSCDSVIHLSLEAEPIVTASPNLGLYNDSLEVHSPLGGSSYSWYVDNIYQGTTTIPNFLPTQPGVWQAFERFGHCDYPTNTLLITGVKNNRANVQFSIVPNPNSGQFELNITAVKNSDYKLSMYNVTGQEMMMQDLHIHQGINTIKYSVENIAKGMYFISLSGSDGITTQNVVIQ